MSRWKADGTGHGGGGRHSFTPAIQERPVWRLSTTRSDQPTSWQTRLFGMGGVAAVALLLAGATLITWTTGTAPPEPAMLSMFNIAPSAAPPEPARDLPPGPEQVRKHMPLPRLDRPRIELPDIKITSDNPLPVSADPPVKATAPQSSPAPPAPRVSSSEPTWEGLVLGALNKVKRYPRGASLQRQQGVPWIRFTMNREGKVLSVQLERSSGFQALDDEAVALPKRSSPLPQPPATVPGDTIELVVPVEFFMR